jgi:hypothetical protein
LWNLNPKELLGSWELVDIAGQGSLNQIMTADGSQFYKGMSEGVLVDLEMDGVVVVKQKDTECRGQKWYFKPVRYYSYMYAYLYIYIYMCIHMCILVTN